MVRMISFFIIGIFILESKICWGLSDPINPEWWESALIYEITFADTGMIQFHNFRDIIEHLDYLKYMQVDAICLAPIFAAGCQKCAIDNFTAVKSSYGSIQDFDKLVEKAHAQGIKVILEVAPYSTSKEHTWFLKWSKNTCRYDNFYIEANELSKQIRGVTWSGRRDVWYCQRHNDEPELQFLDSSVRNAVYKDIFEFWLNRGVDGFRITGINDYSDCVIKLTGCEEMVWNNTKDHYLEMRKFVDAWTRDNDSEFKYLIVETAEKVGIKWSDYYGTTDSPGVMPENLVLMKLNTESVEGRNATKVKDLIKSRLDEVPPNASTNWILSSRRIFNIRLGFERARAFAILSMLLPGQAYTLMGDEVNLDNDGRKNSVHDLFIIDEDRNRIYRQLASLRKLPMFTRKERSFGALNNDAVFVSQSESTDNRTVYMVVLNLRETQEKLNLTDLYSDLVEPVNILLTTDTNKNLRALNVPSRDSISMSSNAAIVLTARRKENETGEKCADENENYAKNCRTGDEERDGETGGSGQDELGEEVQDDMSFSTADKGGGDETAESGKNEQAQKENVHQTIKLRDEERGGNTGASEQVDSGKEDNDDKGAKTGGRKTDKSGPGVPSKKENYEKVRIDGEERDGETGGSEKDGPGEEFQADMSFSTDGKGGGDETAGSRKDEQAGKENVHQTIKPKAEERDGNTGASEEVDLGKEDNDDKGDKTGGGKTDKSGPGGPSKKENYGKVRMDDEERDGETGGSEKDGSGEEVQAAMSFPTDGKGGGDETPESGNDEQAGKENVHQTIKPKAEERDGKTGASEEVDLGKEDNDDKGAKTGGGKTGESGQDGPSKKDDDDKNVKTEGKNTGESGDDVAASGNEDRKVHERVEDDAKGNGKQVTKDAGPKYEEKKRKWRTRKNVGLFWWIIAPLHKIYRSKK